MDADQQQTSLMERLHAQTAKNERARAAMTPEQIQAERRAYHRACAEWWRLYGPKTRAPRSARQRCRGARPRGAGRPARRATSSSSSDPDDGPI